MPPRKKTTQEKAVAKLAALLGGSVSQTDVSTAVEEIRADRLRTPAYWDIESVLRCIEKPAAFTYKKCKRCNEMFGTNYRGVAYCSDSCRASAFEQQTGIKWNYERSSPEQRWGGEPPLVVPPAVFKKLLPWAQHIVAIQNQEQYQNLDSDPQPPKKPELQFDEVEAFHV